jgi:AcrR family transcriptional regulator
MNKQKLTNKTSVASKSKIKDNELIKAKQNDICMAAERLFAKKGYHNTSTREIAEQSKISVGSLYDYINNKEDILFMLSRRFHSEIVKEVLKVLNSGFGVIQELKGTIETTLRVIDRFQEYVLFTYRDSKMLKKKDLIAVLEQESFVTDTFTKIIKRGVEQGLFETDEPEIMANMINIMTHSWALKRYNLKRFSLFSFQQVLNRFVLNGLRK